MTIAADTIPSRRNPTKLAILRQQMRGAIASWVEFAEPEWDRFASLFHIRRLQRGDHFLLPDATLDQLCFVCNGILRAYYLADDGTEANKTFIADCEFAGPLPAAALGQPVVCGIQALEPTTLLVAQYADFAALLEEHPVFGQFQHKLATWLLSRKEMRTRSLLLGGARARYADFVERYPQLAGRVPQYHIASYLGITEVHLSRLRRTLARQHAP
jgi:CRP-like cAMP-binding protein